MVYTIKEIKESDVTETWAPLPKVFGREVRTYFVVSQTEDYYNICKNVTNKFSDKFDIYKIQRGCAICVLVVYKDE